LTDPRQDRERIEAIKDPLTESSGGSGVSDIHIFRQAREAFLETLPENERIQFSACTSASVLLQDVQSFTGFRKEHENWAASLRKVEKFSDHLQPYFEIANIVLRSNPEWSAIAWGALRLILKVNSSFFTSRQFLPYIY
jgi:hypothetical protein